jgi:hypothetical protein
MRRSTERRARPARVRVTSGASHRASHAACCSEEDRRKVLILEILGKRELVGARGFEPPTLRSRTAFNHSLHHCY